MEATGPADISDAPDADGWLPLHWASFHGDRVLVSKCLQAGCNVNAQANAGETPLMC
jgi:ankyrin repeat protein